MSEADKTACQRQCWQIAAVGGVLLWLVLTVALGHPALRALVIAAALAVAGAYVLRWAICGGTVDATRPAAPEPARLPDPAPLKSEPVGAAPTGQAAAESAAAPVVLSAVTPRPDPTMFAAAPDAAAEAPAKPAALPRAAKPRVAAKSKAAAPKKAKSPAKAASATGLDAAMGRTKEASSDGTVLLSRPRGGKGDDLKLIVGVGPKLEKLLNDIGVWHFDQIASWKARDIALVDSRMANFKGRITRDGWVKQARALAKGVA